jgi:hypothetical protein
MTEENPMDRPRPAQWGQPLPTDTARALKRMTRTIVAGERMWDQRAAEMAKLHTEGGYSYDAIAAAAGLTREGVRKSILRWRERQASGAGHAIARAR